MERYIEQNAQAWDWEVGRKNIWTDGCTTEQQQKARSGELDMVLSPFKQVKPSWVDDIRGKNVLALACGGGQQGVLMALAGAKVTVFDISEKQLGQDAQYAKTLGIELNLVKGDMQDLKMFDNASFDLIFNPTSTCFIQDVHAVYRHCHRVLKPGGYFLTSLTNPVLYMFDEKKALKNRLRVKYTIPYSDLTSLSEQEREKRRSRHDTVEFSHTLEDLLGGITDAGFSIVDVYSDTSGFMIMDSFIHDCYLAVRAVKQL
ncbi:class I SAM-dependent methyltransferase [Sphaerochaeta sp.]|uniref:class I SAM-dependent methyltransferase n=1 Tax=Sphaerochaeta sp. TaxID=1972642 RepID=UPI002FCB0F31